jgi:hypothetical protein
MQVSPPAPLSVASRPLSPARGFIADLVGLAHTIPLFPVDRTMPLADLAAARSESAVRISWTAVFLKAFGSVAADSPPLRGWYVRGLLPGRGPRVATASESVASVAINRTDGGDDQLYFARLPHPESRSLPDIQVFLDRCVSSPVDDVFRRQRQLQSLPSLLRRAVLWCNMNSASPKRCTRIGTFSLSTLAGFGASNHGHPTICTTSLSYAPLEADGRCRVTLICDHRVLDGATAARALAALEATLCGPIVAELESLTAAPAPAPAADREAAA